MYRVSCKGGECTIVVGNIADRSASVSGGGSTIRSILALEVQRKGMVMA